MPEDNEFLNALLDDAAIVMVTPEMKQKSGKEQKDHLEVIPCPERTYLIAAAVHKDKSRNIVTKITCKKGIPIGGYVYDSQADTYHMECSDYLPLGYIPVSFAVRMKGLDRWEMRIPVAESVIKKYLNSMQKKELRNFKNHFKTEEYDIQYVQMIDPN